MRASEHIEEYSRLTGDEKLTCFRLGNFFFVREKDSDVASDESDIDLLLVVEVDAADDGNQSLSPLNSSRAIS